MQEIEQTNEKSKNKNLSKESIFTVCFFLVLVTALEIGLTEGFSWSVMYPFLILVPIIALIAAPVLIFLFVSKKFFSRIFSKEIKETKKD